MNRNRAMGTAAICAVVAIAGFTMAPPQWVAIGVAVITGLLYALVFIVMKEKQKPLIGLAVIPVIFGSLILRQIRNTKLEGLAAYGGALQFSGVALAFGSFAIGCYLIYRNEKKG